MAELANTTYQAAQFLTGSLKHFTVVAAANDDASKAACLKDRKSVV